MSLTDDLVKRLRQTRANMLGTDDEEHYYDVHDAATAIQFLHERVKELELDAARYRWLRENGNCHGKLNSRAIIPNDTERRTTKLAFRYWCKAAEADAAIDAALSQENKHD